MKKTIANPKKSDLSGNYKQITEYPTLTQRWDRLTTFTSEILKESLARYAADLCGRLHQGQPMTLADYLRAEAMFETMLTSGSVEDRSFAQANTARTGRQRGFKI